jgi:HEAT repeat protein
LQFADEDRERWAVKASLTVQDDPIVEVRAAAARALTQVGGPGVAPTLVSALLEHSFDLRDSAEAALAAIIEDSDGLAVARALFPVASGEQKGSGPGRDAALRLLGASGHRDAWEVLQIALRDGEPATRAAALEGALSLNPRGLKRELKEHLTSEQDPVLRERITTELSDTQLR